MDDHCISLGHNNWEKGEGPWLLSSLFPAIPLVPGRSPWFVGVVCHSSNLYRPGSFPSPYIFIHKLPTVCFYLFFSTYICLDTLIFLSLPFPFIPRLLQQSACNPNPPSWHANSPPFPPEMPLSHLTLTVSHLPTSTSFFLSCLQPLGYQFIGRHDDYIGFGQKQGEPADFWVTEQKPGYVI